MSRKLSLEQALHCAKCKTKAECVEEHCGLQFAEGEIFLIACPSTRCKERPWYYCKSCHTKGAKNGLNRHASRKHHVNQHALCYPAPPPQDLAPQSIAATANDVTEVFGEDDGIETGINFTFSIGGNAIITMEVPAANDCPKNPYPTM